jgi:hypothetical protein
MNWTTDPPTQHDTYWMQHNPPNREIVVEVLRWPHYDQPVTKLNAQRRGQIPPSSGPGSR